jgi:hypothetical protein
MAKSIMKYLDQSEDHVILIIGFEGTLTEGERHLRRRGISIQMEYNTGQKTDSKKSEEQGSIYHFDTIYPTTKESTTPSPTLNLHAKPDDHFRMNFSWS